jgi:D-beta-D-heptose 7-phosphate kinase/D-beta-D-heptose 1-phosphate adenosyltransferase
MNVASLGATVHLAGLAAQDAAGHSLRSLLRAASISDRHLVDAPDRGTISKTRIVAGQQQICRIDHEVRTGISDVLLQRLMDVIAAAIDSSDIVVLSDYAKGTLTNPCCEKVIQLARAHAKQVIVDPKSKDFRKYSGCSLITPNLSEASTAAGILIDSEEALHRAGVILMRQLPGAGVLITRGPDGMALFQEGEPIPFTIPTVARRVFDVVGAGDTVVATLAVALAAARPLREAIRLANFAAGVVVEKPGTATVTMDELNGLLYESGQ